MTVHAYTFLTGGAGSATADPGASTILAPADLSFLGYCLFATTHQDLGTPRPARVSPRRRRAPVLHDAI